MMGSNMIWAKCMSKLGIVEKGLTAACNEIIWRGREHKRGLRFEVYSSLMKG